MLTATYSLLAISSEQQKAQRVLSRLRQSIAHIWKNLQEIDLADVESAIHRLVQFDRVVGERKMARYVIPALKSATREADGLLEELDALSGFCIQLLHSLQQQAHLVLQQGRAKLKDLRRAMELYCSNLHLRLVREEEELLPLVPRVLSGEEIFELGVQFLSDDGKRLEHRAATLETEELS
ncbi:MAG: hypothetical protein JO002_14470 [Burkholderiaceae bacterium]|nr:hypothetical protein [Burkholderiaceae bacterium]